MRFSGIIIASGAGRRASILLMDSQYPPLLPADPPAGTAMAPPAQPDRPGRISGTALVGGVHLSNGVVGTGSWWRLALTGLAFPAITIGGSDLALVLAAVAQHLSGRPLIALWAKAAITMPGPERALWETFFRVATLLGALVAMRLSPIAGYHAAEHKVVHAIEQFGDVTWEAARRMPRAHLRCGTCLVSPLLLAMVLWPACALLGPPGQVLLLVALWTLRRPLGVALQNLATTREPNDRQMRVGLAAGRKLMHLWRLAPRATVPPIRALWNRGLPQMVAGLVAAMIIANLLEGCWFRLLDW